MNCRVYLFRHGQTRGNVEKRYVGCTDEPLTDEAARELVQLQAPEASLVFVSPMLRCRQTAELLYPGQRQIVLDGLTECSFGEYEYRNYEELKDLPPYQAWLDSGGTIGFPGGETRDEFIHRTAEAFLSAMRLADEQGVETAALIAHGGTVMALTHHFAGAEYYQYMPHNAEVLSALWNGRSLTVSEDIGRLPFRVKKIN